MLSNSCNEKMLDFSGQGLRILVGVLQVSFDYGNLEFIRTYGGFHRLPSSRCWGDHETSQRPCSLHCSWSIVSPSSRLRVWGSCVLTRLTALSPSLSRLSCPAPVESGRPCPHSTAHLNRLHTCGSIMAEPLDPNALVNLEEVAISNMWETSALVELLERKGILTKQQVLDLIQELRQREPIAVPRGRNET